MPDSGPEAGPPLPASTLVSALTRQVTAAGGFATVLARGSPWGGALLLVLRTGGEVVACEKLPTADGRPLWRAAARGDSAVNAFAASQRKFDPDLWVLELDIVDPERFIPGLAPAP